MIGERVRGALLYASAGLVLVAGSAWWVRAAPRPAPASQVERWQLTAERLLPDTDGQEAADTLALAAGVDHEVVASIGTGDHALSVVCVGGQASEVRISLGVNDSGVRVPCFGTHQSLSFDVGLAGWLRLNVSVGAAGPVVFRYSIRPAAG